MFYDNNSLKLYDTVQNKSSTAEFQLFTMIDRYSNKVNELKMTEPLFFSDNTWFIDITTSKLQSPSKVTFHIFMELKNSDITKVYNSHTISNRSKEQLEASLYIIETAREIFSIRFKTILY